MLHAGSIVFNGAMVDLMPWMFVGGTYVLHESFDAERVIEDIARHEVTHIIMVPAQIIAILDSPAYAPEKLASLEMLHNLGAPLHVRFKERINAELPGRFYELYGLTEGFMTDPRQARLDPQAGLGRLSDAVHGDPHPARGRQRRARRARWARFAGAARACMPGYYKRPDLHGEGDRRRLAAHRRCRLPRRGRLPLPGRSHQGHDHRRRRQRLPERHREGDDRPSGGAGSGRVRRTRSEVGRGAGRRGRDQGRRAAGRATIWWSGRMRASTPSFSGSGTSSSTTSSRAMSPARR